MLDRAGCAVRKRLSVFISHRGLVKAFQSLPGVTHRGTLRTVRRRLEMLLFLSMSFQMACAGTAGILEGVVRDRKSGESLPGVTVEIRLLRRGTSTD